MVELKGTEKQVKWANDIREKIVSYLEDVNNTVTSNKYTVAVAWNGKNEAIEFEDKLAYEKEESFQIRKGYLEATIEIAKTIDSAKFFIENREDLVKALVKEAGVKSFSKIEGVYRAINQ